MMDSIMWRSVGGILSRMLCDDFSLPKGQNQSINKQYQMVA